jgi:hypothetical protein
VAQGFEATRKTELRSIPVGHKKSLRGVAFINGLVTPQFYQKNKPLDPFLPTRWAKNHKRGQIYYFVTPDFYFFLEMLFFNCDSLCTTISYNQIVKSTFIGQVERK